MKKTGIALIVAIFAIFVSGIIFSRLALVDKASSVTIIGGADGPTSVFLAGKVGNAGSDMSLVAIVVGIVIVVAVVGVLFKIFKK